MKLNKREIVYLGNELSGANQLSLFANMKVALDGTEKSSLEKKGVLKAGTISPEWHTIFEVLRLPERCARVVLSDQGLLVEKYAYKKGGVLVLAENDQGEMVISAPDSLNETLMELAEFTGMSNVRASDVEALLPIEEVLVLLGVTDIYRNKALRTYLGEGTEKDLSLTDIQNHLSNPSKNSLLKMLVGNYNLVVPESVEIERILKSMKGKQIFTQEDGYALHPEFEAFATSILIPQTIVTLEAFQMDEREEVITAGALCVSAGIKNAMSFVFAGEEIEVASVTGGFLLKMIENFLNCPELL